MATLAVLPRTMLLIYLYLCCCCFWHFYPSWSRHHPQSSSEILGEGELVQYLAQTL